jgi:hypothetical protein
MPAHGATSCSAAFFTLDRPQRIDGTSHKQSAWSVTLALYDTAQRESVDYLWCRYTTGTALSSTTGKLIRAQSFGNKRITVGSAHNAKRIRGEPASTLTAHVISNEVSVVVLTAT